MIEASVPHSNQFIHAAPLFPMYREGLAPTSTVLQYTRKAGLLALQLLDSPRDLS